MKRLIFLVLFLIPVQALALPVVIDGVSSYQWSYGCSPTSAAQVLSYWDRNGFSGLFDASGLDVNLTANVYGEIGEIADWMNTNSSGGTYLSRINYGIEQYTLSKGYEFDAMTIGNSLHWDRFTEQIDLGRPLFMNVNSSTSYARINHSITGIGYEDRGEDGLWYAAYNTWHESETPDWYRWRSCGVEYSFGIHNFASIIPVSEPFFEPVPEPTTILLFGFGLLGIAQINRKKS